MPTSRVVNVSEFINERPITSFQILIAAICFLIVAIDGFDTAAIGFLAPAIRAEWSLSPAELAPIFGAGLLGLMSGAFIFGPMADSFGRKTILVVCVLFFGLMSLASSMSTSLVMLVALRFLTGLGLGGAMPNSVTLTSEYCPEHHRLFLVTTMFCGFTLGSALGGLVSAQMVGAYGWRSVLVLGGVLPIALLPLILVKLPEFGLASLFWRTRASSGSPRRFGAWRPRRISTAPATSSITRSRSECPSAISSGGISSPARCFSG